MILVEILFVLAVTSIALPFVLLGPALAYRALSRGQAASDKSSASVGVPSSSASNSAHASM